MPESITKSCKKCKKTFLIIPQEAAFYATKHLPTPDHCHECRRNRRKGLRNEHKLYNRKCAKCGTGFKTTYSESSPYIIYCEKCYFEAIAD
ncbi:MAG: zinc-ribbon domain containing protein [Patescibacteria group bacterium]|nr:zinc-ribbon domain containing protein [Patescibacteria group bacterium]MBU1016341.1 zinc-ribbon domain containing protein [Patescibacteria group bacterium]MBU1685044.1 zinc-ribbon domain containing protein [Patescibacteria group bacterium]MBU1938852.1 zinc-ribbon domain containing protein [Patescibacteria group bacterium]